MSDSNGGATEKTDPEADRRATGDGTGDSEESERRVFVRTSEGYAKLMDRFIHGVELAAAAVFAVLFAVGVIDLSLQIVESVRTRRITDPLVVIGFIDTGLLLLIIVEVYQTVIAYTQENDTRRIVRLVVYTGVIAMVRKAIIFRTGEYASVQDALMAAVSYTVIIIGLIGLLYVDRVFGDRPLPTDD